MSAGRDMLVRRAIGAGRWFPGDRHELSRLVNGYIDGAECKKVEGPIAAGISPHAGFIYSGKVAGYTFRAIRDAAENGYAPDLVVIVGFSHSMSFRGVALMDGDAIRTPLGDVQIDCAANRILCDSSRLISEDYRPHNGEHSAENQIPFVQASLPDVNVVVALIGDHDSETVDEFVSALELLGRERRLLVVASTDLLHDADYDKVTRSDRATLDLISSLNERELVGSWTGANQVCCGIMPVVSAMRYARALGCTRGSVLHYRNSGDDHPESRGEWVVGYGSVVFPAR